MASRELVNTRTSGRSLVEDTEGSMTVLGLFLFLASGILGAIALDVTSLYAKRTHLQVAADQAAHAALYNLAVVGKNDDEAKAAAIDIVKATLPLAKNGVTIAPEDIQFGEYVVSTGEFIADDDGTGAVRVTTAVTNARENPASSFLFRLIGKDSFEIYASSTFAIYNPDCLNEGFVANDIVDMQNQNFFGAGICVHSNSEVQLQTNNEFQNGSTVSMPGGAATVNVPGDKIDEVEGLANALEDDEIDLRVMSRIENMIYQYENPQGTEFPNPDVSGDEIGWPSYITDRAVVDKGKVDQIEASDLAAGGMYFVDCAQPSKGLTITGDSGSIRDVVIVTPCDVSFGNGSSVQNARIISLSDSASSFKAPSGLSLGAMGSDGCESDGAQLVSMGGMSFAANFSAYGSQIISMGDIKFAATPSKPNDFKGVAMVANGEIDMASHVNAEAGCGDGADDPIKASYFRMVR